jgi:hypothetical protein
MSESKPKGCADCEHAAFKFNGGRGATVCARLDHRIVHFGPVVPDGRPAQCPLELTDGEADALTRTFGDPTGGAR